MDDGQYGSVNVLVLQQASHELLVVVDGCYDVEEVRHGLEVEHEWFVVMDEHEVVEQTLDVLIDEVMEVVIVENVLDEVVVVLEYEIMV